MKASILTVALILGFSLNASAKASKVCFGTADAKGSHFKAEISRHQIVISEASGDQIDAYEGTYKYSGDVSGRDGKTYGEFPTEMCDEGCSSILVDDQLSDSGTKGLIKVRWRGEGYSESKFLCRDAE